MPKPTKHVKKTDRKKAWYKKRFQPQPYAVESREKAKSFLIICEGENTEPWYFKSFPLGNAQVEFYGLGRSKTALVEYVLEILRADEDSTEKEAWVVFDMDKTPGELAQQKEDFNHAIQLAQKHGLNVAYSNDCFELWFVLHYRYLDMALARGQYYQQLSDLWGCNYEKEGKSAGFCQRIYARLEQDERASQIQAVRFAEKLYSQRESLAFAEQNPCTTVYLIVVELNKYL